MFIMYLEGLNPLRMTAKKKKKFTFIIVNHKQRKKQQEWDLALTDGRKDYDTTNWIQEECSPLQKGQYCGEKQMISIYIHS